LPSTASSLIACMNTKLEPARLLVKRTPYTFWKWKHHKFQAVLSPLGKIRTLEVNFPCLTKDVSLLGIVNHHT
jgi:hypothetical protein